MMTTNPFITKTQQPLVALKGKRAGYIQLATTTEVTQYQHLPAELFIAAQSWAAILEQHQAKRIYWLTVAEVVQHLHIHLYPRWTDEESKGISLFEARNIPNQPKWTPELSNLLIQWATKYNVQL